MPNIIRQIDAAHGSLLAGGSSIACELATRNYQEVQAEQNPELRQDAAEHLFEVESHPITQASLPQDLQGIQTIVPVEPTITNDDQASSSTADAAIIYQARSALSAQKHRQNLEQMAIQHQQKLILAEQAEKVARLANLAKAKEERINNRTCSSTEKVTKIKEKEITEREHLEKIHKDLKSKRDEESARLIRLEEEKTKRVEKEQEEETKRHYKLVEEQEQTKRQYKLVEEQEQTKRMIEMKRLEVEAAKIASVASSTAPSPTLMHPPSASELASKALFPEFDATKRDMVYIRNDNDLVKCAINRVVYRGEQTHAIKLKDLFLTVYHVIHQIAMKDLSVAMDPEYREMYLHTACRNSKQHQRTILALLPDSEFHQELERANVMTSSGTYETGSGKCGLRWHSNVWKGKMNDKAIRNSFALPPNTLELLYEINDGEL